MSRSFFCVKEFIFCIYLNRAVVFFVVFAVRFSWARGGVFSIGSAVGFVGSWVPVTYFVVAGELVT